MLRTALAAALLVTAGLPGAAQNSFIDAVGLWAESDAYVAIGPHYRAHFEPGGVRYVPALGHLVPTLQSLHFGAASLGRGESAPDEPLPRMAFARNGNGVDYDLGAGRSERWEIGPRGVEFSYLLPARPVGDGDLVLRVPVVSTLPDPIAQPCGGLLFEYPGVGGVRIGGVTGIDADGRTAGGELRWSPGELQLRLAAEFVETARYPLLVDPLVGTVFNVSSGAQQDLRPDVVRLVGGDFDHVVVFQRVFSANHAVIRGSASNVSGSNKIAFEVSPSQAPFQSFAQNPRIADLGSSRFGVVWQERTPGASSSTDGYSIRMRVGRDFGTGSISFGPIFSAAANAVGNPLTEPVIAADRSLVPLNRFVVLWRDQNLASLRFVRVQSDQNGNLSLSGFIEPLAWDLATEGVVGQVAVPRRSTAGGHVPVVFRRFGGTATPGQTSLRMRTVSLGGGATTAETVLAAGGADRRHPALDGLGSDFVLAYEHQVAAGRTNLAARSLRLSGNGATIEVGPEQLLTNFTFGNGRRPAVAFRPGKTFVAWVQSSDLLPTSESFLLHALDSASCAPCQNLGSVASSTTSAEARVALAAPAVAGSAEPEEGLLVMCRINSGIGDILGQRVSFGTGSNVTPLGGGCGGGNAIVDGAAAIGSSTLTLRLNGSPGDQTIAILNLASTASIPLVCGPCEIQPLGIYFIKPVASGRAFHSLVVPCQAGLSGGALDVQWATYAPGAGGCPVLSEWAFSSRVRLTFQF